MRSIMVTVAAATVVLVGALSTSPARAYETQNFEPIQSWSDLHVRYDRIVDRVEEKQAPASIGGGPRSVTIEMDVLRTYRTPSSSDGFWTDWHDRYDRALDVATRLAPVP